MNHRPADEESTRTIVRDLATASRAAMSRQTPPETPAAGLCAIHSDDVAWIKDKLGEISDRLAKGDTRLELLEHRVGFLEKIVFGCCGLILLAVLGGLVALVIRSGNAPAAVAAAPVHP
jgi:hypothetical protein